LSGKDGEDRRRSEFRRFVGWSAGAHLAALGLVVISPHSSRRIDASQVIAVELVSLPSSARSLPAPPRATPSAPVEKAAPPPPPKPKEIVLPKHPQREPEKPKPEAKPKPVEPRREPEKDLDELLADFRKEAGETEPKPAAEPQQESALAPTGVAQGGGVQVSPEVLAWMRRVKMHVRSAWVVPPGFRRQTLETQVVVDLDASGAVVGEPRITRRSGNPWYDEGVVRAIEKASPLPPPPSPGEWDFVFLPEDAL
jgi:protein TonB